VVGVTSPGGSAPRPVCDSLLRSDRTEWRDPEPLTEGLAAFYRPCSDCWSEQPEPGTIILRSTSNRASVYHKPSVSTPEESADHCLATDGGDLHDLTPADGIERHLSEILEKSGSLPARYHAREALQHLCILEERGDS